MKKRAGAKLASLRLVVVIKGYLPSFIAVFTGE